MTKEAEDVASKEKAAKEARDKSAALAKYTKDDTECKRVVTTYKDRIPDPTGVENKCDAIKATAREGHLGCPVASPSHFPGDIKCTTLCCY